MCRKYKLPLFLDGARLIYGLVSKETDVTLHDIARLCDVFYIGGTKAGLLCGEAVVFTGKCMPKHFLTRVNSRMEELKKDVQFGFWEKADDSHTVVRFATSWATRMEDVQKLLSLL